MNPSKQQIEDLLKNLDNDLVLCFKCKKKDKKHKMIGLYNHKTKNTEYMCSLCFKLQHKRRIK